MRVSDLKQQSQFHENMAHFLVPLTLNAAPKTTAVDQLGSGTHRVKDPGEME